MSNTGKVRGKISSVKDLRVWQIGMDIVVLSNDVSRKFPKEETYGITSQIRPAAVSIPANISEGFGRFSRPEFIQFLKIARGSIHELRTHFEIALRLDYLTTSNSNKILCQLDEGDALITALMRSLSKSVTLDQD